MSYYKEILYCEAAQQSGGCPIFERVQGQQIQHLFPKAKFFRHSSE